MSTDSATMIYDPRPALSAEQVAAGEGTALITEEDDGLLLWRPLSPPGGKLYAKLRSLYGATKSNLERVTIQLQIGAGASAPPPQEIQAKREEQKIAIYKSAADQGAAAVAEGRYVLRRELLSTLSGLLYAPSDSRVALASLLRATALDVGSPALMVEDYRSALQAGNRERARSYELFLSALLQRWQREDHPEALAAKFEFDAARFGAMDAAKLTALVYLYRDLADVESSLLDFPTMDRFETASAGGPMRGTRTPEGDWAQQTVSVSDVAEVFALYESLAKPPTPVRKVSDLISRRD